MKMLVTEDQYNDLLIKQPDQLSYTNVFNPENGEKLIKGGRYGILLNNEKVGGFGIGLIGDVELDPDHWFHNLKERTIYPNSIFFTGGFFVYPENHKQGIGRKIIHLIFEKNPDIQNIFLYALTWQKAIPFWEKLGAKIILEEDHRDIKYIQINRNNLR